MEFPSDFPREAQLKVRQAEIAASQEVAKALAWRPINSMITGGLGAPLPPDESVQQYALSIFAAFAGEACELGRQNKWSLFRIDEAAREFIREIIGQAKIKYPGAAYLVGRMVDSSSGSILPNGWREIEATPEWTKYRVDLRGVQSGIENSTAERTPEAPAHVPNPWHIWEANRELPDTTAKLRLHGACKTFREKTDSDIFRNKGLWRTVEKHLTPGQVLSYGEPNPEAMLAAFCKHCRWFLSEVSEAFIEHIARRGLAGQTGINAFSAHIEKFTAQAFEHNWKWGLGHLRIPTVNDGVWEELAEGVRAWKLKDLAALWAEEPSNTAPPSSETPSPLVARRVRMLEEYKRASGNPSNRQIYTSKNSSIHKPQFHEWLKGSLEETSQTCTNFERFLREKKAPIPRNPK